MTIRHFTASAVVLSESAEYVLLIWHHATGRYQFPGGHIDPDESGDEAALREAIEETGVHPVICSLNDLTIDAGLSQHVTPWRVFEMDAPAKPDRGPGKPAEAPHRHIDLLFLATSSMSAPIGADDAGTAEPRWWPVNDLALGAPDWIRADVPVLARLARTAVVDYRLRGGSMTQMTTSSPEGLA